MPPANAAADAPIFATVLTPHASLGPRGFLAVMTAIAGISFTAGTVFWLAGAWPVIGFMGLDVLLVYVAFRLSYRAARAAEEITVTRAKLTVRRVAADGRTSVVDLDPYWARLEVDSRPEYGVTGLRLASHGRRHAVGTFLGPGEREVLAVALAAALAEARTTP